MKGIPSVKTILGGIVIALSAAAAVAQDKPGVVAADAVVGVGSQPSAGEVQRFDNVQVGDTIVLRYTEALGLRMIKE